MTWYDNLVPSTIKEVTIFQTISNPCHPGDGRDNEGWPGPGKRSNTYEEQEAKASKPQCSD